MNGDRLSANYYLGLETFIQFAKEHASEAKKVRCPCTKCVNFKLKSFKRIRVHCQRSGFSLSYTNWIWHGEVALTPSSNTPTTGFDKAENPQVDTDADNMWEPFLDDGDFDEESVEFRKFVDDAQSPLYDGSENTKIDALIKLHSLKAKFGLSDTCFTEVLETLSSLLPNGNVLPQSLYESKKTMSKLGLDYLKIHACPNDCILYRNSYADAKCCPKCGLSQWKLKKDLSEKEGQPAKVLWYFPIIPRLRRWFKSPKIAEMLSWHHRNRSKDGHMRHPADSPQWKLVDYMCTEFANEARNLRFGLSADGINPHSNMSSRYSCWPVLLVTYNLPSWLCMKRKFMMLSLLISSPKQPGLDIDIYLEPLIDDLQNLWNGVSNVYDAHKKEYFTLRGVLLWTINDFPAYGNLSGCTTKGYKACPICGDNTTTVYL